MLYGSKSKEEAMSNRAKLYWIIGIFLVMYYLPLGSSTVTRALLEGLKLLQWYVINHTLACVLPAMFIAGAIRS